MVGFVHRFALILPTSQRPPHGKCAKFSLRYRARRLGTRRSDAPVTSLHSFQPKHRSFKEKASELLPRLFNMLRT